MTTKVKISGLESVIQQHVKKLDRVAYNQIVKAQNKLRDKIKQGYQNSSQPPYNIRAVTPSWAMKRRSRGGPGDRRALFHTGALMRGVRGKKIKRKKMSNGMEGYEFGVEMSTSMHPSAGIPMDKLASLHENGYYRWVRVTNGKSGKAKRSYKRLKFIPPRPLWQNTMTAMINEIRGDIINGIKYGR